MKNNFGWKLTLSLIQIVCIVPPISICGIISCIFTAKANTAYLDGRLEDYKRQARVSTIALLTGLVFLLYGVAMIIYAAITDVMIRSSVENKMNQQKQMEASVPLSETKFAGYNTFVLQDREVTLPMTFEQLEQLNLNVEQGEKLAYVVNPGESAYVTLYTMEDWVAGKAYVYNDGDSPKALNQCMVVSLEIDREGGGFSYTSEKGLINGMTFQSEEAEIFQYFGEPDKEYISEENAYALYSWFPPSYKENGWDAISVTFSNERISKIKITYLGKEERRK